MDEDRVKRLEERLQAAEAKLWQCEARADIQNLMGRYALLMAAGRFEEILESLWSRRADRTLEEGAFGVYSDVQLPLFGLDSYYNQRYGMPLAGKPEPERRGRLTVMGLTSPALELAPGGNTAVGSWIASGHESRVWHEGAPANIPSVDAKEPDAKGRRFSAFWVWQKISVEFLLEEGGWRIWHMHLWDVFRCPFDRDWISYAEERFADDEMMDAQIRFGDNPTHSIYPTTKHWQYTPDALPPGWPDAPQKGCPVFE